MKIENLVMQFHPQCKFEDLKLSSMQQQYLALLRSGHTIAQVVEHFMKMGWLVNFRELYALIDSLAKYHWLTNQEVKAYFEAATRTSDLKKVQLEQAPRSVRSDDIKRFPFFRSLKPELSDFLLRSATHHQIQAREKVCEQGELSRDLFALVKGSLGIYKTSSQGGRVLVAVLSPGSVFGEAGFLLGEPRSADIVALELAEVVRIPYKDEVIGPYLNSQKARELQIRFWIQHALQKSDLFKNFPSDCLDAMTFAGRVVQLKEHQALFKQGDLSHAAFVVVQGSLVIQQNGKNINVLNQGTFLGEVSLLATQGVRTASAVAQQDSLLLEIRKEDFYHLLGQNIYLAKEIESLCEERIKKDMVRVNH